MKRTLLLAIAAFLLFLMLAIAVNVEAHPAADCPGQDPQGLPQTTTIVLPSGDQPGRLLAHGLMVRARVRKVRIDDNSIWAVVTFNREWTDLLPAEYGE